MVTSKPPLDIEADDDDFDAQLRGVMVVEPARGAPTAKVYRLSLKLLVVRVAAVVCLVSLAASIVIPGCLP
jgi:hypothetical protein